MNSTGYVMSYRSTFEHWVADDPKMFMAWQEIVHAAAYEDYRLEVGGQTVPLARGEVNITGLESRRFFTDKQWRSFIERLVECQMIARVAIHQLVEESAVLLSTTWFLTTLIRRKLRAEQGQVQRG